MIRTGGKVQRVVDGWKMETNESEECNSISYVFFSQPGRIEFLREHLHRSL